MITKIQSYFIDFPAESKLWVFMADKILTQEQIAIINQNMRRFLTQWNAHGNQLSADFHVIEDRFLVVAADETQAGASGCSIDSLTRFVKQFEEEFNLSFTNRMLVAVEENEKIELLPLKDFKEKVKNGEISPATFVYNNSLANLSDFWDNWKLPLKHSWAANLLP